MYLPSFVDAASACLPGQAESGTVRLISERVYHDAHGSVLLVLLVRGASE